MPNLRGTSSVRRFVLTRAGRMLRAVSLRRNSDAPERVLRAARQLMRTKTYCLLVTDGADGPDARVVQPFRPDADLVVHVGTSPHTRKAQQVATTGRATLVYEVDRDRACVVLHCAAHLVDDRATRRRYFMPLWRAFWPDGPDGPDRDFVVIRCVPDALEVWDARRAITPPPFGLRSARLVRVDGEWRADQPDAETS